MTVMAAAGWGVGSDPLQATRAALAQVADRLGPLRPDLALVFAGAGYARDLERIGALVTDLLAPAHLMGVTTGGVIADGTEIERGDCLSLWAARLNGAEVTPLRVAAPPSESASAEWPPTPAGTRGVVLLADPFTFPSAAFLEWLEQARPGLPVCGGQASAGRGLNRLLLDGDVYDDGAVAVALGGDVRLRTLVSQGCRPIGKSYTVTRAERNLLQELGGAQPVQRVQETFSEASPADKALMRTGLHIGTLIDEYKDEFGRGDFLVRGVLGAESGTGAIVIGDLVSVGQTAQFHVRDAASADEDLRELLDRIAEDSPPGSAGLLFSCNGRGRRLFGQPDHDAALVRAILGDIPLAGFFAAGEFGPIGARNFIHGYTASLLVFEGDRNQGETSS
ncbi:MAG: FIST signal transduction protein [Egibacteraceae bacterium]